jgi:MFS family permease
MPQPKNAAGQARTPLPVPFFYGWVVVALSFLACLVAAGIRSAPAVLIHPLEAEFGWSRTAVASAASLNLFLYGLAAPLGGWLIDRHGARRVILGCLALVAGSVTTVIFVRELWQLILVWGLLIGIATGLTAPLGASVASRWFVARRGIAVGILTNGNAAGQVIFLPLLMALIVASGWRTALLFMVGFSLLLMPFIVLWLRDDPSDVGLEPYGSGVQGRAGERRDPVARGDSSRAPIASMSEVFKTPSFWLLSGCFFVCGVTANGLIGTHLVPHAIERGIPQVTAATVVGVMGGMSFVGTLITGWLVDRIDPRKVLAVVYALRGSSLFILPFVTDATGLLVFAVIYGLDWFASGPGTVAIIAEVFGRSAVGRVFGLAFVFHQLGGALAAVGGGWVYSHYGEYQYAFIAGGILGLMAAGLALTIPLKPRKPIEAIAAPAELASA